MLQRLPKNNFDLPPLQDHIERLRLGGFVVYSVVNHDLSGQSTYSALVLPADDHQIMLKTDNDKRLLTGDSPGSFLPDECVEMDPRYCEDPSAWAALVASEEAAAKMLDDAAPEAYVALEDTTWFQP